MKSKLIQNIGAVSYEKIHHIINNMDKKTQLLLTWYTLSSISIHHEPL